VGIAIITKGVDSGNVTENMLKIAKTLAYEKKEWRCS
jgi:hydroxyethylthiazole kinase-like sugar kinase family protein